MCLRDFPKTISVKVASKNCNGGRRLMVNINDNFCKVSHVTALQYPRPCGQYPAARQSTAGSGFVLSVPAHSNLGRQRQCPRCGAGLAAAQGRLKCVCARQDRQKISYPVKSVTVQCRCGSIKTTSIQKQKRELRHDPNRHHFHGRIIRPRQCLDHQPSQLSSGDRASATQHGNGWSLTAEKIKWATPPGTRMRIPPVAALLLLLAPARTRASETRAKHGMASCQPCSRPQLRSNPLNQCRVIARRA